MSQASLPDLNAVQRDIDALSLSVAATELHGSLCGLLAAGGHVQRSDWLRALALESDQNPPAAESPLDRLYLVSESQLGDPDCAFELLLPDEDASLMERTEGLLGWCRGFLGGFGLGAGEEPPLSAEAREALDDLARLAAADPDLDDDEGDESALAEIEEFVRVAVLLLYSDCHPAPMPSRRLH